MWETHFYDRRVKCGETDPPGNIFPNPAKTFPWKFSTNAPNLTKWLPEVIHTFYLHFSPSLLDEWLQKDMEWTDVSDDDAKSILNTCGCLPTAGMSPYHSANWTFVAGPGRDPFPYVIKFASVVDTSKQWLYLHQNKWRIGYNTQFPSSLLYIRKVSHKMADFIIKHFETAPQEPVQVAYILKMAATNS